MNIIYYKVFTVNEHCKIIVYISQNPGALAPAWRGRGRDRLPPSAGGRKYQISKNKKITKTKYQPLTF